MVFGETLGDIQQVDSPHSGRQQTLVRIAESRVGIEDIFLLFNPLRHTLGAFAHEELLGAVGVSGMVLKVGHNRLGKQLFLPLGTVFYVRIAVDNRLGEIANNLGTPVAATRHVEQLRVVFDKINGRFAASEIVVLQQIQQKVDVGFYAAHPKLAQSPVQPVRSARHRASVARDLHQQTVEKRRNHRPRKRRTRIQANAHTARRAIGNQRTVVGFEAVTRVFGRHAALYRAAENLDVFLRFDIDAAVRQFVAHADQKLRTYDVDTRNLLGNRVLDLNARIDLDEVNIFVFVHQKLDRTRAGVVGGAAQFEGVGVEFVFGFLRQSNRRGDLDHLLKATLHGAIALVEVHQISVLVSENLHLDVLRIVDIFFDKNRIVAECRAGFVARFIVFRFHFGVAAHDAHPASAAARGRFNHDGVADFIRLRFRNFGRRNIRQAVFNQRNFQATRQFFRPHFITELHHRLRTRADKNDAFLAAAGRKLHVFRQKTVARVNGLHPAFFRHTQDFFDV